LWRYTFPDSPQEYARILVQSLILQAQTSARSEQIRHKYATRQFWEDSPQWPELARIHYGFVDAHRDLNLTARRREQK